MSILYDWIFPSLALRWDRWYDLDGYMDLSLTGAGDVYSHPNYRPPRIRDLFPVMSVSSKLIEYFR